MALLTDRAHAAAMEPVRREVEALLARQPGVTNAAAVLTAPKTEAHGGTHRHAHAGHGGAGAGGSRPRSCCRT